MTFLPKVNQYKAFLCFIASVGWTPIKNVNRMDRCKPHRTHTFQAERKGLDGRIDLNMGPCGVQMHRIKSAKNITFEEEATDAFIHLVTFSV